MPTSPAAISFTVTVTSVLPTPLDGVTVIHSGASTVHAAPASARKTRVLLSLALSVRNKLREIEKSRCAAKRLNSFHTGAVEYSATAASGTSTVKLSFATPLKAVDATVGGVVALQVIEFN